MKSKIKVCGVSVLTKKELLKRAKSEFKTIVFPEAGFSERIMKCAMFLNKKKVANVILIGDESSFVLQYKNLKGMTIINPKTSDITESLANLLFEKRKDKGLSIENAEKLALDPIYFGTLLVESGFADCMVAGAETPSSSVIRSALQVIGAKNKGEIVSSYIFLQGKNSFMPKEKMIILSDVGLNINPSMEEIVQIANQTAKTANEIYGISPRLALLSYSTNGSAGGECAKKMRDASLILKNQKNLIVDGEMQLDSALDRSVCMRKFKESEVCGDANVLIFPDLQSGNITYKAMQKFGNLHAIGPILQNLNKPINDLSRGATVEDIIYTSLITLIM